MNDLTILLVDDDADAREVIELMLRASGARVVACASADEALEAASSHEIDVIVSDVAMPGKDGLEFMRQLRQRRAGDGGELPALALTAHASAHDVSLALAAGFQRHVAKPVQPSDLITAIAQLAGANRAAKTRS